MVISYARDYVNEVNYMGKLPLVLQGKASLSFTRESFPWCVLLGKMHWRKVPLFQVTYSTLMLVLPVS